MLNFVPIVRTFAEIWPIIDFSRWQPAAILDLFYVRLDHPRKAFVGLYHCAKFGFGIGAVVSMICHFNVLEVWLENDYSRPFWVVFGGFHPLDETQYQPITKVESTDHSGSRGILFMMMSVAVPEKCLDEKVCRKRRKL